MCSPSKPSASSTYPERLQPNKPFLGVGGGSTGSLGQIRLSVIFGTYDNYRTELIDFDITHICLRYNAILR